MARWQPDARGRLERAALELFVERGYDQTTVGEIAERAGLKERSFYRYFADKREVMSPGHGQVLMETAYVDAISTAAADAPPIEAVRAGLHAAARVVESRGDIARQRYAIVAAHPELQERELLKRARLATVIEQALRQRDVAALAARLTAQLAVAVFSTAYAHWSQSTTDKVPSLAQVIDETLAQLANLTSAASSTTSTHSR